MSKHTPGKWFIDTSLHIHSEGVPVKDKDGGTTSTSIHLATAKKAADAILMAAAPELLEALSSFLRAPSVGSNGPSSTTIVVQDFNMRAARAAIAKATGSRS